MSHAVVMSGGGAKGAFEVGVLSRLIECGELPDAVYGTSVGALNAAGYAFSGIQALLDMWLSIKGKGDILSGNWISALWSDGLYSMNPLKKKIDQIVKGSPICPATVCATDLIEGSIIYARNFQELSHFKSMVLASACIPFVMQPVAGRYVDGGVREQTPLKQAIRDGHDKITVILCNPLTESPTDKWKRSWPYFLSAGLRTVDMLTHEVFLNDIEKCLFYNKVPQKKVIDLKYYAPERELYDTLEFEPTKLRAAIEKGRNALSC